MEGRGGNRRREGEREAQAYSERGGGVCLLLCSTWIHPFLSAFHSHSRARSLCHCHARTLSFFPPFSFLRSSPFHPRLRFFFLAVPPLEPITPLSPSPHLCSTPLTLSSLSSLPSSAWVLFIFSFLLFPVFIIIIISQVLHIISENISRGLNLEVGLNN